MRPHEVKVEEVPLTNSYLVFALANGLKETLLGAVERQTAREEDEEDDSTAPHVHRLTVRLPLHHFWGHEVGSTNPTWG